MQIFVVTTVLFLTSYSAYGQQTQQSARQGSNWERVRALPANSFVYVDAGSQHKKCGVKVVDADSLTCTSGNKDAVFQRADIKSVKLRHRGRSTAIAAGVGAGAGAILGAAGTSGGDGGFMIVSRGGATVAGALGGALIGAPIGFFTHLAGSTIYRAP